MAEETVQVKVPETRPDSLKGFVSNLGQLGQNAPAGVPPEPTPPPPAPEPTQKPPTEGAPPAAPAAPAGDDGEKFPRSSKDWDAFKKARKDERDALQKERDEIKKERDGLTEKLKTLSSFKDTEEYKAIIKERDELSEQLRIVEVTRHPKFKSHFDGEISTQINLAKQIVGNEKADDISKILSLPAGAFRDRQIRDFVADLDVFDQGRISNVVNALSIIESRKEAAIQTATKDYATLTEKQKREQEQAQLQRQTQLTKFIDDSIKGVTDAKDGNPAFQKRDGDDKWNQAVDRRIETVKGLLTGEVSQRDIFNTAVNAVAYHQVVSDLKASHEKIATLEAQVKALTVAQPSLDANKGNGGGNGEQPAPKLKRGTSPQDATTAMVRSLWQDNG